MATAAIPAFQLLKLQAVVVTVVVAPLTES